MQRLRFISCFNKPTGNDDDDDDDDDVDAKLHCLVHRLNP